MAVFLRLSLCPQGAPQLPFKETARLKSSPLRITTLISSKLDDYDFNSIRKCPSQPNPDEYLIDKLGGVCTLQKMAAVSLVARSNLRHSEESCLV